MNKTIVENISRNVTNDFNTLMATTVGGVVGLGMCVVITFIVNYFSIFALV